jgi:hypothetical protein
MRQTIPEQLLETPMPIDRVARRVTKKAKPEHIWAPAFTVPEQTKFSKEVLPTIQIPKSALSKTNIEGSPKKNAKWVVRCDCGNYEHRCRIVRWLGTKADDACLECRERDYRKRGKWNETLPPAERLTKAV